MADQPSTSPSQPVAGRWQLTSGSFNGEAVPELVCRNTELRISGDRYAFFLAGEITDAGLFRWSHAGSDLAATMEAQTGINQGRKTECRLVTRGQLLRLTCAITNAAQPDQPPSLYRALFTRIAGD